MFRRSAFHSPSLQSAIDAIREASHTVVLTGAGISTPSGIPDFRSSANSLWSKYNPFEVASIWGFREKPERFYEWIRPLAHTVLDARPNPAHVALAELERRGYLKTLVTQNIDNLHQLAGSQNVLEVHGHLRTIACVDCGHREPAAGWLHRILQPHFVPTCPHCGGPMKPDVVLFGEPLAEEAILAAQEEALRSDLFIVAGSSLEVLPAADLPALAVRGGARLIIINLGMTPYDHLADILLPGDVADILPRLIKELP